MGLYHVCLFCVSYVCNLVLFIMIGRVWGEQKQTKKKPWNGIVIVVVRSLLRTSERAVKAKKGCFTRPSSATETKSGLLSCQPFCSSSLIDVAAAAAKPRWGLKVKICAFFASFSRIFFFCASGGQLGGQVDGLTGIFVFEKQHWLGSRWLNSILNTDRCKRMELHCFF